MTIPDGSTVATIAAIVFLLYFRRAVFRLVFGFYTAVAGVFVLIVIALFGVVVHDYFGLTAALVGTLMLLYALGVMRRRTSANDSAYDDDADDQARLNRDEQLREDRRLYDAHQDAIRRNPW